MWALLVVFLTGTNAYREVREGETLVSAIFEPYHPGFVGRYGEARNPRRFRVNPGGPLSATQPNVFASVFARQTCPGMIGPLSDGAHYCTSQQAGLCDRRSGTCFCFEGYQGESCQDCRPTHFRLNATAECRPRVHCPLDCSGAGTCDHLSGFCTCQPHRTGLGCETQRCPGIDPNCVECDFRFCRTCREGYALTNTNRCAPCWLIDPRCASCTSEGKCTQCADPLLNSIRRSGRRARDLPLPFDELFRELSHNLPFASKSHLYFQEAEPFFDTSEAILVRQATTRLAATRAAHAAAANLTLHPAASRAADTSFAALTSVDVSGLGYGDGLVMGEPAPSLTELGLTPGFVGGTGLPGAARADTADSLGSPGSPTPSKLLASGFTPSWPGWQKGFWPLYEAAVLAPGADAYTLLALRGQMGNSTLAAMEPAEVFLNSLANITGMGSLLGPSASAEPDGRAGWAGEIDSLSPAARETRSASTLVARPPDSASAQAYYRLFNDSSNRTWPLWQPLAWYNSRGAVPLRDQAMACDQGVHLDRRWRCHAFPISHAVCGHPGTISWASPEWAVREDEGRVRVAVRRSGGGLGRVEMQWWLVHNTTGAADVTATAQYQGAGAGAGGGSRTLVMEEGVVQLSVELTIHDDLLLEGNETAWLVLGPGVRAGGVTVGPQRVATLTIIDDDADRASPAHSMISSPAAVAALPSHPASRIAGVPAAAELAAVAGEPLVLSIHARSAPFGASFLGGLDQTLGGVQGPTLAALDARRRAATAAVDGGSSSGGGDTPAMQWVSQGVINGSTTLPTAEPRLLVPFGGHWAEGAEAGEAPGAIRYALEVWPARGGGGLGLGDSRRSGGGSSGLSVGPSAAGYAAAHTDLSSAESAALADARADPWAVTEVGRAGIGPAWSDALGLGGIEGARPLAGGARTGEAGAWAWEEGEATAAARAGGAAVWGRSGVRRRLTNEVYDSGQYANGWNVSGTAAPLSLSDQARSLWFAPLPWAPAGSGIVSDGAFGSPWEPADGWQGENEVLASRPWAFRFGSGYGQGRMLGAPVARGEVVWAGAISDTTAATLDALQLAAAERNRAMGLGVAATGNASLVAIRALRQAGLAASSTVDAEARRLSSAYVGAVRPLRAGDYELHATQCTPGGLIGEYWTNTAMLGPPAVTRIDAGVNFTWGHSGTGGGGEAAAGAPGEALSARWTGRIMLPPAVADAAVTAFSDAQANANTATASASSLSGILSTPTTSASGLSGSAHPGWMPWWAVSGTGRADPVPGVLVRFFLSGGRGDQARLFVDHRLVLDRWGHDYTGPGGRGATGTGGLDDADAAADVLAAAESGISLTGFRSPEAKASLDPIAGDGTGSRSPGGLARPVSPSIAAFGDPYSMTWAWGGPRGPANMSDAFVDIVLVPGRMHSIRMDWRGAGHPHAAARLDWALPAELIPSPQTGASQPSSSPTGTTTAPSTLHRVREPFLSAVYTPANTRMATAYWDFVDAANGTGAPASIAQGAGSNTASFTAAESLGVPSRQLLRGAVPAGSLLSERAILGGPIPLRVRANKPVATPSQVVDGGAREAHLLLLRANGLEPTAAEAVAAGVAAEAGQSGLSPWLLGLTASVQGGCGYGGSTGCGGTQAWGAGVAWGVAGSAARFTVSSRDGWGNDRLDAGASDSFRVVSVAQSAVLQLVGGAQSAAVLSTVDWQVPGLRTNGSGSDASGTYATSSPGAVISGAVQYDPLTRAHTAAWLPVQSGRHWLHVQLWTTWQSWSAVKGSPFAVTIGPGDVTAGVSDVSGIAITQPVAGEPNTCIITARDSQGNPIPAARPSQLGGRFHQFEIVSVPASAGAFADSNTSALMGEASEAQALGAQPLLGDTSVIVPSAPQAVLAASTAARLASFSPLASPTAVSASLAAAGGALPPNSSATITLASYSASLLPSVAGPTTVSVRLANSGAHAQGSPFRATVLPGPTFPAACVLSGLATQVMVATQANTMGLHLRDQHGNPRQAVLTEQITALMTVAAMGSGPHTAEDVHDNAAMPAILLFDTVNGASPTTSSTLGVRLTPTAAGVWPVSVLVDGADVHGSPRVITVVPGALHAPSTIARGASLDRALAGVRSHIDIDSRDAANNTRSGPASDYLDTDAITASFSLVDAAPGDPIRIESAAAAAASTVMVTPLASPHAAGEPFVPRGGSISAVQIAAALGKQQEALVSGFYRVSFALTVAGNWTLRLTAGGLDIKGSPFTVTVYPNALDAATSIVSGSGAISQPEAAVSASSGSVGASAAAGEVHTVMIRARDAWGNAVLRGGEADRIAVYRLVASVPRALQLNATAIPSDIDSSAGVVDRFEHDSGTAITPIDGSGSVVVSDSGDGNYTAHFLPADSSLSQLHIRTVDTAPMDAATTWASWQRGGIEALAGRPGGLVRHVYAVAGIADSIVESARETLASLSAQTSGWWPVTETALATVSKTGSAIDGRFGSRADLAVTLQSAVSTVGELALPLWVESSAAIGTYASALQGTGLAIPIPSALSQAVTGSLADFAASNASGINSRAQYPVLQVSNISSPDAPTSVADLAAAGLLSTVLRAAPLTQLFGNRAPRALHINGANGTLTRVSPIPSAWGTRWEGWWRLAHPRSQAPQQFAGAVVDIAEWTVAVVASSQLRLRLRIGVPTVSGRSNASATAPLDWAEPTRLSAASSVLQSLGNEYASAGAASESLLSTAAASAISDSHLAGPGSAGASLQTPSRLGHAARLTAHRTAAAAWIDAADGSAASGGLVNASIADTSAVHRVLGSSVWSWAPVSSLEAQSLLSRALSSLQSSTASSASSSSGLAVYAIKLRRTLPASDSGMHWDWLPLTMEVAAPSISTPLAVTTLVQDPVPLPDTASPLSASALRPAPRHLTFAELAPPQTSPFAVAPLSIATVPAAASGPHTVASGAALTSASVALPTSFLVEVRDRFGNPRRVPGSGDQVVAVAFAPGSTSDALVQLPATCVVSGGGVSGSALFNCSYTAVQPGNYQLHVAVNPVVPAASLGAEAIRQSLTGSTAIDQSPFSLHIATGAPVASSSIAYGPGLSQSIAGEMTVFIVQPRDAERNNRSLIVSGTGATSHGITVEATLVPGQQFLEPGATPPTGLTVTVSDVVAQLHPTVAEMDPASVASAASGLSVPALVSVSWQPIVAGQYLINVADNGSPIAGSPFAMQVLPAAASPQTSYTTGVGVPPPGSLLFPGTTTAAGAITLGEAAANRTASITASSALSTLTVVVRDSFGNRRGGSPSYNRNEGADAAGEAFYRPGTDDSVAVRVSGTGRSSRTLVSAIVSPASSSPVSRGVYTVSVAVDEAGGLPIGSVAQVDVLLLSGVVARDTAQQLGDGPSVARWQDDMEFGHGFKAEYYAESSAGRSSPLDQPVVTRVDRALRYASWPLTEASSLWTAGAAGVRALRGSIGSVRWTGWIVAPDTGDFRFAVAHARGARVLLGWQGTLVVDRWTPIDTTPCAAAAAGAAEPLNSSSTVALCSGVIEAYTPTGNDATITLRAPAATNIRLDAGQAYEIEILWRPPTTVALNAATATPDLLWAWQGSSSQQTSFSSVPSGAMWPGASHIYASPITVQL